MNAYLVFALLGVILLLFFVVKFNVFVNKILNLIEWRKDDFKDFANKLLGILQKQKDEPEPIDEDRFLRVEESVFYMKYGNVAFTNARTVTFSNAFYELLIHDQHQKATGNTTDFENNISRGRIDHYGDFFKLKPDFIQCDEIKLDFKELEEFERIHEEYLCELLGENFLGKRCRCPDGRWCNWRPETITQFLFLTDHWRMKSIDIYTVFNGKPKKISSIKKTELSPNKKYTFVSMSNSEVIKKLEPGTDTYVVFTIEESLNNFKCAVLRNIVPTKETIDSQVKIA